PVGAGVTYVDRSRIALDAIDPEPRLRVERENDSFDVTARLLVDASGGGGFLPAALGLAASSRDDGLQTDAIWSHFAGVERLSSLLSTRGHDVAAHPYTCDDAAVHHLFDGGWMWSLRFDDGIVSAGFVLDRRRHSPNGIAPD